MLNYFPGDKIVLVGLVGIGLAQVVVLGGHHHFLDSHRFGPLIFHRHLRLAVRTQPGQFLGLAHLSQSPGDTVGQHDRQRHQRLGFTTGKPEHQSLVSGPLLVPFRLVHALGNFRALLIDAGEHRRLCGAYSIASLGIADIHQHLADYAGNVYVSMGGNLSCHQDQPGGG